VNRDLGARVLSACSLSLLMILAFCLPDSIHAGSVAGPTSTPALAASYGSLPLSFERNDGQTDARVKFFSRGSGYNMFLTSRGAVLVLTKPANAAVENARGAGAARQATGKNLSPNLRPKTTTMTATVLRLELAGEKLNRAPKITGAAELPGRSNYFRGSDPRQWVTNIANYQRVEYRGVYPGVNMVYYGNQRQLEYDMVVAPHADPAAIRFQVEGAANMEVAPGGDLLLHTATGDVVLRKPVLYQQSSSGSASPSAGAPLSSTAANQSARQPVDGSYAIQGSEIHFQVGAYDRSRPLVIDPVLSYSTFLGGSQQDLGTAIAVDGAGNTYIAGQTGSPDFPITNSIQPFNGGLMVFISKLNPAGNTLLYSTYLGGASFQEFDAPSGIAVDGTGNVYVTGTTFNADFPVTFNGYLTAFPGPSAAFVSKLNASGNTLLYSSFLGSSDGDVSQFQNPGSNIAVDASGNVYITGNTGSDNFPTTPTAFLKTKPGQLGIPVPFISRIDTTQPGAGSLVYSTYFGGSGGDSVAAIAARAGKAYITGVTSSSDFRITAATAFQPTLHSTSNAFVSVLDTTQPAGTALVYSSYLGGTGTTGADTGLGIAVDSTGKVDVTGRAVSIDFPVKNAFQGAARFTTCGGNAGSNAFVSQFDPTQTGAASLVYSTYLGGSDPFSCAEEGNAITADGSGKIYVTGQTDSPDFPIKNPLQAMPGFSIEAAQQAVLNAGEAQVRNVFVSQLDATQTGAASLLFSTYLGGSDATGDTGYGVAVDSNGANVYITGQTGSYDFPTAGPVQPYGGNQDAFAAKITMAGASPAIQLTPDFLPFSPQAVNTTVTKAITLKNAGNASLTVSGISLTSAAFSQTNTCGTLPVSIAAGGACTITITSKPPLIGVWSATLTVTDNSLGSPHRLNITGAGETTSTTALASSVNPSAFGQSVVFKATVTAGAAGGTPPTGPVQFMDGATVIDTEPVIAGVATSSQIATLPAGSHSITAVYGGDGLRTGSTSNTVTQVVNMSTSTTAVISVLNPSTYGQNVILAATITPGLPGAPAVSGTVQFQDGANPLGAPATITAGVATLNVATLTAGSHSITAVYSGDTFHTGSTSPALTQVVNQAATTTAVATSFTPSTFGVGIPPTFTATITANNGLSTVAGGTVVFKDGGVTLGTNTVPNDGTGQTTFTPASNTVLAVGTHPITAIYQGDAVNWSGSTSAVLNQVVVVPSITSLSATINGQPVSGTAFFTRNPAQKLVVVITVTGNSGTPLGTVNVTSGSTTLATASLVAVNSTTASVTLKLSGMPIGVNQITAVFPPSGPYAGSTSNTVMVYQSPRPKIR
jgi:hypothetical protein